MQDSCESKSHARDIGSWVCSAHFNSVDDEHDLRWKLVPGFEWPPGDWPLCDQRQSVTQFKVNRT